MAACYNTAHWIDKASLPLSRPVNQSSPSVFQFTLQRRLLWPDVRKSFNQQFWQDGVEVAGVERLLSKFPPPRNEKQATLESEAARERATACLFKLWLTGTQDLMDAEATPVAGYHDLMVIWCRVDLYHRAFRETDIMDRNIILIRTIWTSSLHSFQIELLTF